jgi:hypothetical protein
VDSMIPQYSARNLQSELVKYSVELKQKFCVTHIVSKAIGS